MKATWILGAALFLGACGGAESDEGAAVLGNDGQLTEVKTVDLTASGRTYVIDVRDDGGVGRDLKVRSNRGTFAMNDWLSDVSLGHNVGTVTSDDGTFILMTNVHDIAEDVTPEDLAATAREQARGPGACPEECMHCPEDNVFLCQTMCGARR